MRRKPRVRTISGGSLAWHRTGLPPVASAVFAACAISRGSVIPTAGYAILLSLSLFLVPFLFVNDPVLLLEGPWPQIVLAVVTSMLGVGALTRECPGMVCRPQPFRHNVRGSLQCVTVSETRMGQTRYTEFMTLPLTLATIGYLMNPIPLVLRIVLGGAALALLRPGWVSDLGGLAVAGCVLAVLLLSKTRHQVA